jgi:hypothetical protein
MRVQGFALTVGDHFGAICPAMPLDCSIGLGCSKLSMALRLIATYRRGKSNA